MAQTQALVRTAKGIYTSYNPLHEVPEGAVLEATNCAMYTSGAYGPRRGFNRFGTDATPSFIFEFDGRLFYYHNGSFYYDSDGLGTWLPWGGTWAPPETDSAVRAVQERTSVYITTSTGIHYTEDIATTPIRAGMPTGLDFQISAYGGTAVWFYPNKTVGYRVLWGRLTEYGVRGNLTPVSASAGDRIVIEIGYQARNTVATSYSGYLAYGTYGTTDAVLKSEAIGSGLQGPNSWIEFSQEIGFQIAGQLQISQLAVEASNYDGATGVQLQVSQLAAEASNYGGTIGIRASQVVVEVVDTFTGAPPIRASQLAVEVPTTPQEAITHTPSTGTLTLTGNQPTVTEESPPPILSPSACELTLTGNQPTVDVPETGVTRAPVAGELTLTGNQPTVEVTETSVTRAPVAGELTLTGNQPDVTVGQAVWPATGTLRLTGNATSLLVPQFALPGTGTLILTGGAPVIRLYPIGRLVSQLVVEAASSATAGAALS